MADESHPCGECSIATSGLDRRAFLFGAGAAVISLTLPGWSNATFAAQRADYPHQRLGKLSELIVEQPVTFRYPWDHPQCECILLRLSESAGGGLGPQKNVVAFHTLCTHMGAAIPQADFRGRIGIAGPCPLHLTTFDLTKHGMVISGHATQGLPQVIVELDGDDIIAVGVLGLLYGFHDNQVAPV